MKPLPMIVVGSALAVAFSACKQDAGSNQQGTGRNRFGHGGTNVTASDTAFTEPPPAPQEPVVAPTVTPPVPPPSVAPVAPTREISYGTPVPGKAGFVTSPHSPYAGYVDVRGFPPGTEVKCPYSGKIFLVP